ncbi:MAG: toll/interleukin-1 receptor domain-containing protein [Gammaproteobacteria bacterium]|nr:toll/interleukin-1 receptor domain-containing protein [Gammaproteobacteria bacterium]
MAFVPGFEYDIFISYTHKDNVSMGSEPGWVKQFHDFLEKWLENRRGLSGLRVWRANELDGNTRFDVAIEDKLKKSALFFALHSRNYPKSDYCRKELDWFHQHNGDRPGGLMVGDRTRIFNILLNNLPHDQWQREFAGSIGFPMHDAESEDELGEFTSPQDPSFGRQLRKIVDAAEETLKEMVSIEPPVDRQQAPDEVRIFIADVADPQQSVRERIIAEIGSNALLLEECPPPLEYGGHERKLTQILERTDLSIHLLDQWPGRKITDRKETTYPQRQTELACVQQTPQIIWVPEDCKEGSIVNKQHHQ